MLRTIAMLLVLLLHISSYLFDKHTSPLHANGIYIACSTYIYYSIYGACEKVLKTEKMDVANALLYLGSDDIIKLK